MDTTFWVGLVNIIVLDIALSGDNEVVIGMAARTQRRSRAASATAAATSTDGRGGRPHGGGGPSPAVRSGPRSCHPCPMASASRPV